MVGWCSLDWYGARNVGYAIASASNLSSSVGIGDDNDAMRVGVIMSSIKTHR